MAGLKHILRLAQPCHAPVEPLDPLMGLENGNNVSLVRHGKVPQWVSVRNLCAMPCKSSLIRSSHSSSKTVEV